MTVCFFGVCDDRVIEKAGPGRQFKHGRQNVGAQENSGDPGHGHW